MGSANEVKVSYIADIRDLTDKLKSVTGITASEVRQQVAAVVAGQKAQAAATSRATAATKAATASAKEFGDAAEGGGSRALKALGPLGGVLSRISPEAGAVASSIAGMTSAVEGLGPAAASAGISLGGMAVAAGVLLPVAVALGGAYLYLKEQLDAVEASNAAAAATASAWQAAAQGQSSIVNKIADDYAVATGAASTYDIEIKNQTAALNSAREGERKLLEARVAAAGAYHTPELVKATEALADYDARTSELADHLEIAIRTKEADTQADKNAAKAKEDAAAASRDAAAAAAKSQEGFRAVAAQLNKDAEEEHKAEKAYSDMVLKDAADQAAASKALADQQIADAKRVAEEQERARVTRLSDEIAVMGAVANLGNQLVSATTKQYDTTTAAGRKAALKQFRTQKAANLAIGAINTAVAVSTALKDYPVPPLSIVMGGIALGSGIAAEAAIASSPAPSFHSGYAPDEMQAKVLKSEPVVSPVGAEILGRRNIAEANAGKTPSGSGYQAPAPVVIDHRVMESLVKREISNGGALASALRSSSGTAYGHRKNRRSVTG